MDSVTFFDNCLNTAGSCIKQSEDKSLDSQTTCSDWNLKQLLYHIAYELAWVPPLLSGKSVAEVGDELEGDLLGKDPVGNIMKLAVMASCAAQEESVSETVHLSYADVRSDHYLKEVGTDILIHGWDVAKTIGVQYEPDQDIAITAWQFMSPREKELNGSGLFGNKIQVQDSASDWEKLLGLTGRIR